jgi:hypothetical protein
VLVQRIFNGGDAAHFQVIGLSWPIKNRLLD